MEKFKAAAIESALKSFNGYPLSVSEAQLNNLVKLAQNDDLPMSFACQTGEIVVAGQTRVAGIALAYSTRLALEACEISPDRKQITLRRLDHVDLGGNGLAAALFARVIKVLLCGLFGIDLARLALKNNAGIRVEKDLITADLDAMGATDLIVEAIKARLPDALAPLLDSAIESLAPGLGAAGNAFLAHIGIDDIAIEKHEIKGMLRIHQATAISQS